jgi:antitoxin ParD1/3/4
MASLNVNMPKDLGEYVDRRTAEGGFGTPTEYVRHLIRRDKETEAERELERLVMEGIRSGRSRTKVKTFFARLHKRIDELEQQRKGGGGKAARSHARG